MVALLRFFLASRLTIVSLDVFSSYGIVLQTKSEYTMKYIMKINAAPPTTPAIRGMGTSSFDSRFPPVEIPV